MPLYIKIDFRLDAGLGAWWSRSAELRWIDNEESTVRNTRIRETRIRDVLIAIADQIDPDDQDEPAAPPASKESIK